MREAKSYSIVDHEVLHGGYLARLSHKAIALYVFLCVVGDRYGKSYYNDISISNILRLGFSQLTLARDELIGCGLIEYHRPNWWVRSLSKASKPLSRVGKASIRNTSAGQLKRPDADCRHNPPLAVRPETEPTLIRGVVPRGLRDLLKSLERGGA